jgi:hypothetical protein
MRIVGCDPGKTGALALFVDGHPTMVTDMPLTVGGIDGHEVYNQLCRWQANEVYIESTHAMPTNGSKAAFSQGDSNGALRTAAHIARVPLIWVRPLDWQRSAALGTSGLTAIERKRRSRMRAIELFPSMADWLNRAKDHNRAEALLIGRFGVKTSITDALVNS